MSNQTMIVNGTEYIVGIDLANSPDRTVEVKVKTSK